MTANERCKKEIIQVLADIPKEVNGAHKNVSCIYYDSFNKQVNNYRCMWGEQLALNCWNGFRYEGVPYMSVIALVHHGEVIYQNDRVITNEAYEELQSVSNKDDFTQKILSVRDGEGRINIMEAVKNDGQVKPMAIIEVSEKYVKTDIERKDGSGTFNAITIPKGTMIGDKDYSFYTLLVNRVLKDDKTKTISAVFEFDKSVKMTKREKEGEEYKTVTAYEQAGKIAQAVRDSYEKFKQSQKEENEADKERA